MKTVMALTIAICLFVPTGIAQAAGTSQATASPLQQTQSLVQTFVADYNQHNLGAVMSLMGSHIKYADCNYSTHVAKWIEGKKAVSRWFKHMFALHDTFHVTSIIAGGWSNEGPVPNVFGLMGTRTNDAITRLGLPPQPLATKGGLNGGETRMRWYLLTGQASCDK